MGTVRPRVVDRGNSRIVKYDRNGRYVGDWGEKGDGPGQLDFPHAVVVDARDRVFIAVNWRLQLLETP